MARGVLDAFFRTGTEPDSAKSAETGLGTGFRFIPESGLFRYRIPVPDRIP
jgi:hypothetical protein